VVDWRSGIAAAVGAFVRSHGLGLDPGEFADAWRGLYMPSMARVRSGERPFVSLDVLHRENLVEAAVQREHVAAGGHGEGGHISRESSRRTAGSSAFPATEGAGRSHESWVAC
jgi:hypothetical protein